jgi:FkbM family methyltransferase
MKRYSKNNRIIGSIQFVRSLFFLICNIKKWGPFLACYETTKFDYAFSVSWSQSGEDLAIEEILNSTNSSKFYIDIGAHHPSRFSVTRRLYQSGWKGINVDANAELETEFRRNRPRDQFLGAAIGDLSHYKLYVGDELAVSTTNLEWKSKFEREGMRYTKMYETKGRTLKEVLDMDSCPFRVALVNIDIEGSDLQAIKSAHLEELTKERWPTWFLVESNPPLNLTMKVNSVEYLLSLGYELWLLLPHATLLRAPE